MNKKITSTDIDSISINDAEFAVLDFETTGGSAKNSRVIEFGIAKVKNGKITDTFESLINPGCPIPPFITQLTGITDDDVAKAPAFEEIVKDFSDFIGNSVITAHNLKFDFSFLQSEYANAGLESPNNPQLCTLVLARKLYPELKSKSLGALTAHFKLLHKNVHRALGDAAATAKLLIKMLTKLQEEHHIEKLIEAVNFTSLPGAKPAMYMIKKKLATDISSLPDSPGVYMFKNKSGEIIYIGKAKSLRKRVRNYFMSNAARKTKQIVRAASRLSYIETNSELTALLLESEMIKKIDPPYNSQLKRYSQFFFLKVNLSHIAPDIKVDHKFEFNGNDYFGPYSSRDTAKSVLDIINKTYKLRECTEKEFKAGKKCYLYDIERCTAPCSESGEKGNYDEEMEHVYEFLAGNYQNGVNRLLKRMKNFSDNFKYEEAAKVRDTVNTILDQLGRSTVISEPVNKSNVLIVINEGIKKDYLLLSEGRMCIYKDPMMEKEYFLDILNDYFEGTINLISEAAKKDLELLKITLAWILNHKYKVELYYLKDFSSIEELSAKAGF